MGVIGNFIVAIFGLAIGIIIGHVLMLLFPIVDILLLIRFVRICVAESGT